jgi:hypothetical protein
MAITMSSSGITFSDSSSSTTADLSYKNYSSPTRSIGTTYTNTTGQPLIFWVTMGHSGNSRIDAKVDGVSIALVQCTASASHNSHTGAFLIVPNGSTYSLNIVTATGTSSYWTELS